MYEQINISMTAEEIAQDIKKQKEHEKDLPPRQYDWLSTLAGEIYTYLDSQMNAPALAAAKTLMSKGLAGIGALPDLINHNPNGVASYVKEIYGIWVKDNTPNQVVSAAMGTKNGLDQLSGFTNDVKKRKKPQRATRNAKAISDLIIERVRKSRELWEGDEGAIVSPDEKAAIRKEVKATLINIHNLIHADTWLGNQPTTFGHEKFDDGNSGLGVRKDTFVTIPSGKQRKLHLAEIRSDWTIDKFTKDHSEE